MQITIGKAVTANCPTIAAAVFTFLMICGCFLLAFYRELIGAKPILAGKTLTNSDRQAFTKDARAVVL